MVVAILGQDSPSIVTRFFDIPGSHPVLFPTLFVLGSGNFDGYCQRYEMYNVLVQVHLHGSMEVNWNKSRMVLHSSLPWLPINSFSFALTSQWFPILTAAASAYVLTSWPLFHVAMSSWTGVKTDEIQVTMVMYIRRNSCCVLWRLHLWGNSHSWNRVPSRRGMD